EPQRLCRPRCRGRCDPRAQAPRGSPPARLQAAPEAAPVPGPACGHTPGFSERRRSRGSRPRSLFSLAKHRECSSILPFTQPLRLQSPTVAERRREHMTELKAVSLAEVSEGIRTSVKPVSILWQAADTIAFVARGRRHRSEFH